jgi:hypothetical protein
VDTEVSRRALALLPLLAACASEPPRAPPAPNPPPAPQNPSPMIESTRQHGRVPNTQLPGVRFTIDGLLARPIEVFVPATELFANPTLLVHFHGAAFVPEQAVYRSGKAYVLAVVNLGAGSGVYERPFADARLLLTISDSIRARVQDRLREAITWSGGIVLSGFSAGSGAIRAILRNDTVANALTGVMLLDGIHTSYLPEGKVLADGGVLDTLKLESFVRFARRAVLGEKRMLVTHSEIFPGTFASTTETADYILRSLGLPRTRVLSWGPVGMQRLSEVDRGAFRLEGFAGNTAPDHIDHFHGYADFLQRVTGPPAR